MNYATIAPIVERMQPDERFEFYFTSSESPDQNAVIYADARQPFKFITPLQASLLQFDVYLAADFLWMKLPRGARLAATSSRESQPQDKHQTASARLLKA